MDEWLCSSTHNKDNVEALDKCAPLARFITFVLCSSLLDRKNYHLRAYQVLSSSNIKSLK